ncbi:hypothetical protein M758_8G038800 [Ceratodon purpureus]|uniref:Uncharacterized protein n=1 Tax=Ceratodon purpureus TaxID=3225 RepID=A0A8T0GZC3_CERPU|nr:hypothetical protein KC19_8G040400 [Ceratodon purpureus]KAG0607564.1 hypothetical protein M758_8G038800 [Ceratodon purpureus]
MTAQVLALALLVHDAPLPTTSLLVLSSFLPSLHCIACSQLHPSPICPSLNSCSAHSLSHSQPHSTINQSPNPYLPASQTSTALFLISQLTYNSHLFTPSSVLSSTS